MEKKGKIASNLVSQIKNLEQDKVNMSNKRYNFKDKIVLKKLYKLNNIG